MQNLNLWSLEDGRASDCTIFTGCEALKMSQSNGTQPPANHAIWSAWRERHQNSGRSGMTSRSVQWSSASSSVGCIQPHGTTELRFCCHRSVHPRRAGRSPLGPLIAAVQHCFLDRSAASLTVTHSEEMYQTGRSRILQRVHDLESAGTKTSRTSQYRDRAAQMWHSVRLLVFRRPIRASARYLLASDVSCTQAG